VGLFILFAIRARSLTRESKNKPLLERDSTPHREAMATRTSAKIVTAVMAVSGLILLAVSLGVGFSTVSSSSPLVASPTRRRALLGYPTVGELFSFDSALLEVMEKTHGSVTVLTIGQHMFPVTIPQDRIPESSLMISGAGTLQASGEFVLQSWGPIPANAQRKKPGTGNFGLSSDGAAVVVAAAEAVGDVAPVKMRLFFVDFRASVRGCGRNGASDFCRRRSTCTVPADANTAMQYQTDFYYNVSRGQVIMDWQVTHATLTREYDDFLQMANDLVDRYGGGDDDYLVFNMPQNFHRGRQGVGAVGWAFVGGIHSVVKNCGSAIMTHEIGHNFGLNHGSYNGGMYGGGAWRVI
jgi:hypothetical protein